MFNDVGALVMHRRQAWMLRILYQQKHFQLGMKETKRLKCGKAVRPLRFYRLMELIKP